MTASSPDATTNHVTVNTASPVRPARCWARIIVGVPVASQNVHVSGLARFAVTPFQNAQPDGCGPGPSRHSRNASRTASTTRKKKKTAPTRPTQNSARATAASARAGAGAGGGGAAAAGAGPGGARGAG